VRAEPVTDSLTTLGEGPVWDGARGRLLWVDQLQGDVLATTLDGGAVERFHVGSVAACVVPRSAGGIAVATKRGFALVDDDGTITRLPPLWDDRTVRMNDGACDARGRFYCGSLSFDQEPDRGAVYRLDPDRSVHLVLEPVTLSNGLGWSPDGSTAYYVDSATQRVDAFAFDPDAGTFHDRRPLVEIPAAAGLPDGLTVDAEGGVWVALWRGGVVHRYAPDGALTEVVEVPVTTPTSCVFAGDALDRLVVTTSRIGLDGDEPLAGALFAVDPGVVGLPTAAYDG
jgi:sugar lactone lactonase YvrE